MKQREANIERNRAHEEELRDAFAALANMNSAGGSKKTAGGTKAQEMLATRKLRALGDQLVKVLRDLFISWDDYIDYDSVCRAAHTTTTATAAS